MSAYMAVSHHDIKWLERYNNAIPQLDNILLQARKIFPEIIIYLDEIEAENKFEYLLVFMIIIILLIPFSINRQRKTIIKSHYKKSIKFN